MPPKRTASTSSKAKRKASSPLSSAAEDSGDEVPASQSQSQSQSQRSRASKKSRLSESQSQSQSASQSQNTSSANAQPTNVVLPVNIVIPPKAESKVEGENVTRIVTWNVCGLAASQKKGFKHYIESEDPDILILTETKVNNIPVDPVLTSRFPHRYWNISEQKGYAGTAIFSKIEPKNVSYALPSHPTPNEVVKGRLVTMEFENLWLVGTYVPNAGDKLKNLSTKEEWNVHFEKYLRELDATKPVIWTGDLNVAPTELDLANPKRNWNKTPGYTESETSAFKRILNPETSEADGPQPGKLVDVWRQRNPDLRHYTYFSYRFKCREKGLGWRLDMFVVSERLVEKVLECEIRSEIWGASDHCPVMLELQGSL
ncbi:hypothetical protein SISSUDRAFT_1062351 [Sistotremastrum suecicum HHB10207 ss-3]|uniref:DNA-(apurinic or apyrimidinic site) endonuclease n=1 Tax=Sistotremastrum suecicum HHB10207 ss-3 TaxID=1314776 RepID=A0A166CYN9_9AGAM|nr:hypothetical protein SISSUDRAFT_1062351 [Sistotremastrum suecicum HHB10207 ss-3]